jgi:serine/threonine-protein kinase RsbT
VTVTSELRVLIRSDADVLIARQRGRELARNAGLTSSDLTLVATAISELARNIFKYARQGEVLVGPLSDGGRRGIVIQARDEGPGIADVGLAMQDGYSTAGGLGLGLPGTKRLMDDFEIHSEIGRGTTVVAKKWVR